MCLPPAALLPLNSPLLSEQLRWRTDDLRSKVIAANYNTKFCQTAPELTDFRHATAGHVEGMNSSDLSETFQKTVRLTTYESYAPLLAKFFEKPCKTSATLDLFAPGIPDYIARSSSTSGGLPKTFPKYNRLSKIRSSSSGSWAIADPLSRRTKAYVWYLGCDRIHVEDEDCCPVATMYLTFGSVLTQRACLYLDPEKDEEKMGTFLLDHAAPYAAGFVKKWRSFLLIHALFAVASRSLETMSMGFLSTFVNMIRCLDMEFHMVVDCVADGIVPDLEGIADVRHYLEVNMLRDPKRAAELRSIGRPSSRPGWCSHIWPNLRSVMGIASGSFASAIPLARWFLGPNTEIRARGYGSTEAWIGSPYNPLKWNQFKLSGKNIVEFLDISKSDSISALVQLWEVELGRQYELVLTTHDGLWRYRLGDVVEICGFDPTDGIPVIQFVERRDVVLRLPAFMFTEKELRAAMSSMAPNILVKVIDWTATVDDRRLPATIGFFVELVDDQGKIVDVFPSPRDYAHERCFLLDNNNTVSNLALAPECVLDELSRLNTNIAWAIVHDMFRTPTIRLVRSGTFSDFRQMKLDEGSNNLGQVKVPVVLPQAAYVTWFSNRVMQEL